MKCFARTSVVLFAAFASPALMLAQNPLPAPVRSPTAQPSTEWVEINNLKVENAKLQGDLDDALFQLRLYEAASGRAAMNAKDQDAYQRALKDAQAAPQSKTPTPVPGISK